MPLKVAAFYQFAALPDFRELREPLRAICAGLGLKGSVLLAHEGINGTIAGEPAAIDALVEELQRGALFGGRLDNLELKFSQSRHDAVCAAEDPAEEGDRHARRCDRRPDPTSRHLCRTSDWNALISAPDTLVIDTRNAFEVAMGTFEGAVDPGIRSFGQFKDFAARHLDPAKHRKIAMFCTGGIRCEKASAYLLAQDFPKSITSRAASCDISKACRKNESRWRGECFVFDERVALGHGLQERQMKNGSHE